MKIGIIFAGYNNFKHASTSIIPWILYKKMYPNNIFIAAVSVPFKEYENKNIKPDSTTDYLINLANEKFIDICFDQPKFIKENEARNMPLFYLLDKNVDYVMIVDSDELYSLEDIARIIQYISENDLEAFKINFKNYILDGKTYLDGFCPFRIFKTKIHDGIDSFYWDNDIKYRNGKTNNQLIYADIPKEVAYIKHMTWLNENGKEKVEYHLKHFGACSYKWNQDKMELEIDWEYYDRMGYSRPILNKE
jgi:hypothetical protein